MPDRADFFSLVAGVLLANTGFAIPVRAQDSSYFNLGEAGVLGWVEYTPYSKDAKAITDRVILDEIAGAGQAAGWSEVIVDPSGIITWVAPTGSDAENFDSLNRVFERFKYVAFVKLLDKRGWSIGPGGRLQRPKASQQDADSATRRCHAPSWMLQASMDFVTPVPVNLKTGEKADNIQISCVLKAFNDAGWTPLVVNVRAPADENPEDQ